MHKNVYVYLILPIIIEEQGEDIFVGTHSYVCWFYQELSLL